MSMQDDPNTGARELQDVARGFDDVLYIGISCGISAPYVLGQVEWAMRQPKCVVVRLPCCVTVALPQRLVSFIPHTHAFLLASTTTVLMGFNPVHLARGAAVEGWTKSCRGASLRWTLVSQC